MEKKNNFITSPLAIFLLAGISCFLWGSATPSIKTGYALFGIESSATLDIILFAGIRFFLAGILVILIQSAISGKFIVPEKGSLPSIIKLALAQTVIQYFCFYIGLAHTSGVAGTIVSGASGFFSILIASLIFKYEKLTSAKIIGCVLGLGGIIIMNVHPGRLLEDGTYSDPRVLTIYELMKISSLPDNWDIPQWASENLIRYVIGEGIPPLMVKKIMEMITRKEKK